MTEVTGGAELGRLGHRLREADRKDLMRELRKGMEAGVAPLGDLIVAGVPAYMPKDYELTLADALVSRTSTRTTGRSAAVELVMFGRGQRGKRRQIRTLNNPGVLRHPVFGRYRRVKAGYLVKGPWARQYIRAGFFDDPVDAHRDEIREEAREAMRRVAVKITKDI